MTQKDYIRIAAALKEARDSCHMPSLREGVDKAAQHIAAALGRERTQFNRERFMKACGVAS